MKNKFTKIGLISISDRASKGEYEDQGIPHLKAWLQKALTSPFETIEKIIPDERPLIESSLIHFVDVELCDLILTTGGTGPALRDVTPDATLAIADREMPGFGEQMRQISLHFVPTAILSRQVAVVRKNTLIINLPGQPKSIAQTLEGLKNDQGEVIVHGIFAGVPYCIDLLNGSFIETHQDIVTTFRPKTK
ncbi:molybdopterin adenylyltransferase [Candidatus Methylopumilus planktonicus]|uniref:molybdopterin adenylyltransferase n=1 Tax=Candidatus Methylopumilus planktonicus TaxID=1581557 RepID=UPI00111E4D88|nr:molybdopterin adenylyltransferase [Candidatus Methylopumilus planktonicus]QDD11236.1 molybdopterin adenylyltransferase [Candidatus Methylopumilus planktonicus]QDD23706.1 molybdopterin adenylyltransferase [Candidatus Methylopumilus planktonicus]